MRMRMRVGMGARGLRIRGGGEESAEESVGVGEVKSRAEEMGKGMEREGGVLVFSRCLLRRLLC